MTQVTMPVSLGASGDSYSDDGSAANDMTNGGHRTNLMPLLEDVVAVAASALASAVSAVNAPGTNGTSVTALTIGTGAQAFTTQTGKAFVVGQSVKIAITASPTNWMLGDVTAYDSGTGAMTVEASAINGSGAASAWTIGLSAPTVSLNYVPYAAKTAAYTVLAADMATLFDCSHATGFTLGYTAAATLGADWWGWVFNSGAGTITLDPASTETINGALTQPVLPGELWLVLCTGAALQAFCLDRPSLSGSATAPSPTYPLMWWADTGNNVLKRRNADNSAWVSVLDLATGDLLLPAGAKLIFDGATEDAYKLTVSPGNPTANRTQTHQDLSGTLALVGVKEVIGCFPAGAMKVATTSGAAPLAWDESTTNKVMTGYLAFDKDAIEYAQFGFRAPKALDAAVGFTVLFVWKEAGSATAHNCVWQIEMQAQSDGDTIDSAWGTAVTVTDTGVAGKRHISPETAAITPGGSWAAGDEIIVRIARKATDAADTLDVDAHLVEVVLCAVYASSVEA